MTELVFDCLDVRPDRYAAGPVLQFKLRISETSGDPVHAIALRCQIRIEPHLRRYAPEEETALADLFGDVSRWGETLKPFQFAFAAQMVPGFTGSTEVDVPVQCTYDLEVAATKYFNALGDGDIPLLLLFSGSVFSKGETGFSVSQVPWHKETQVRMPVSVWRELMDLYFPGQAWIRMRRDTIDRLLGYRSREALPSWDETFERLMKAAGEDAE
ncbi:MAG TPA: DUF6084 family protein [Actinomycetota bacterium]